MKIWNYENNILLMYAKSVCKAVCLKNLLIQLTFLVSGFQVIFLWQIPDDSNEQLLFWMIGDWPSNI